MINRLIIGAPFGNYLSFRGTTSTAGTFTLHRRAGLLGRAWRVLRTVRFRRADGSWVNRLGLPNPGIDAVRCPLADKILSVRAVCPHEWEALLWKAVRLQPAAVELNLSCPNAGVSDVPAGVVPAYADKATLIAKLSPVQPLEDALPLYEAGVRHFHLCNTIPSPAGGVSGKPLKPLSLRAVEAFRVRWGGSVTLVGGGGVTCLQDVKDYVAAGADHVAVASVLFNPLNWRRVRAFVSVLAKEVV